MDLQIGGVLVAGLITAIVLLVKQIPGMNTAYSALVAVAIGVVLSLWNALGNATARDAEAATVQGVALGLMAIGLYSGGKTIPDVFASIRSNASSAQPSAIEPSTPTEGANPTP